MKRVIIDSNSRTISDSLDEVTPSSKNTLHDYDIAYVYPSNWPGLGVDWRQRIVNFLDQNKPVVVFCNGSTASCLSRIFPIALPLEQGEGKNISFTASEPWGTFYKEHIGKYQYIARLNQAHLLVDKVRLLGATENEIIAVKHKDKPLFFIPFISPDKLVEEATGIEKSLLSLIFPHSETESPLPKWLDSEKYLPVKVSTINENIQKKNEKINGINEKIERLAAEKENLLRWRGLLFLGDEPLESLVNDALALFGAEILPKFSDDANELEHVFKISGKHFVGDSKGKNKALVKRDISQLRTNVTAYETAEERVTDGQIIFLNHHRLEEPENREDAADPNLIQLAEKFKIKIVSTTDVFALVKAHLDGDTSAKARFISLLTNDAFGLVKAQESDSENIGYTR